MDVGHERTRFEENKESKEIKLKQSSSKPSDAQIREANLRVALFVAGLNLPNKAVVDWTVAVADVQRLSLSGAFDYWNCTIVTMTCSSSKY